MTIAAMISKALNRISLFAAPIGPCGSNTPPEDPASNAGSTEKAAQGNLSRTLRCIELLCTPDEFAGQQRHVGTALQTEQVGNCGTESTPTNKVIIAPPGDRIQLSNLDAAPAGPGERQDQHRNRAEKPIKEQATAESDITDDIA